VNVIDMHRHDGDEDEVAEKRELWDSLGYTHVCYSGNLAHIRELMARYPGYAIGFAHLKMDDGPFYWRNPEVGRTQAVPVDEIDRYKDEGFRGLKVIFADEPYSHEKYFPYYERAQQLGMPVLFHTGWVSGSATLCVRRHENYRPVYVQSIASNFPDLPLIIAHLGGWQFSKEAVIAMWKHPNVYADLCGATMYRFPTSFYRDLFCFVPPGHPEAAVEPEWNIFGKLVYGTDNDDDLLAFYQRLFDELGTPESVREKILWKNMAGLLGLDDASE